MKRLRQYGIEPVDYGPNKFTFQYEEIKTVNVIAPITRLIWFTFQYEEIKTVNHSFLMFFRTKEFK